VLSQTRKRQAKRRLHELLEHLEMILMQLDAEVEGAATETLSGNKKII
jgi:hypothetical protein